MFFFRRSSCKHTRARAHTRYTYIIHRTSDTQLRSRFRVFRAPRAASFIITERTRPSSGAPRNRPRRLADTRIACPRAVAVGNHYRPTVVEKPFGSGMMPNRPDPCVVDDRPDRTESPRQPSPGRTPGGRDRVGNRAAESTSIETLSCRSFCFFTGTSYVQAENTACTRYVTAISIEPKCLHRPRNYFIIK